MWNSHEERQLDGTCLTPGRDKDGTANAFGWPPADAPDGLRPPAARPLFAAPHWLVLSIMLAIWVLAFASIVSGGFVSGPAALLHNWPLSLVLHLPYLLLLCFLGFALLERFGFLLNRHKAVPMGVIDRAYPKVCIQIPMFNEGAVARRIIEAAVNRLWNRRFTVTSPIAQNPTVLADTIALEADRKLYNTLSMLLHSTGTAAPESDWPSRLTCLIAEDPTGVFAAMGFPDHWQQRPLWAHLCSN
jgi:hypothetical protein